MAFKYIELEEEFVFAFKDFVKHDRLECFFDPYAGGFLPLMWNLTSDFDESGKPNDPPEPALDTIEHAVKQFYGAPLQGIFFKKGGPFACIENLASKSGSAVQYACSTKPAEFFLKTALKNIATSQVNKAFTAYSETWLQDASSTIFMSYFVELPNLEKEGLIKTYELLNVVTDIVTEEGNFHIAGPLEFRFVKAGDTVMSGTYKAGASTEDTWFVNLDLIGFVKDGKRNREPSNYPSRLLEFMATVERHWFEAGGLPHQGKMYGFYDPYEHNGNYCPPFNDNFIRKLNEKRDTKHVIGGRKAFNAFRKELDPDDLFLNPYIEKLVVPSDAE